MRVRIEIELKNEDAFCLLVDHLMMYDESELELVKATYVDEESGEEKLYFDPSVVD